MIRLAGAWEKLLLPGAMTAIATRLASGEGWLVEDVTCTAGPSDRPFEERHGSFCIAAVTHGSFEYRTAQGSALLAPGSLLLGNAGACFECGHEHAAGDRCLAFHYAPALLEEVVAAVPGARRLEFGLPRLPPLPALLPWIAAAEAERDDPGALEELALGIAGTVAAAVPDKGGSRPRVTAGEARRVTAALRLIEARSDQPLPLAEAAGAAGMSRFHFLRTFRSVVGLTPHQYVLRTRIHRAAVRLRRSAGTVTAIALDCGFGDLSTFNRQFRRATGQSPSAFRARARP